MKQFAYKTYQYNREFQFENECEKKMNNRKMIITSLNRLFFLNEKAWSYTSGMNFVP